MMGSVGKDDESSNMSCSIYLNTLPQQMQKWNDACGPLMISTTSHESQYQHQHQQYHPPCSFSSQYSYSAAVPVSISSRIEEEHIHTTGSHSEISANAPTFIDFLGVGSNYSTGLEL